MNKFITVFGNPMLAAELAIICAKYSDQKTLIIDADLLHPSLDRLLSVKLEDNKISIKSDGDEEEKSGLLVALDAANKNMLSRDFFMDCTIKKNKLHIMTGNYKPENYEYLYLNEESFDSSFIQTLNRAKDLFDVIIVIVQNNNYDRCAFLSMQDSDYILSPTRGDALSIRNSNNELDLKINLDKEDSNKYLQVIFEYNSSTDLPIGVIKNLCHYKCAGIISYNTDRRIRLNKRVTYSKRLSESNKKEYSSLLKYIGIETAIPKRSIKIMFSLLFKKLKFRKGTKLNGVNKLALKEK